MDIKKIIASLALGESVVVKQEDEQKEGPKAEIKDKDFAKNL